MCYSVIEVEDMLDIVMKQQKTKRYIIFFLTAMIGFYGLYLFLDVLANISLSHIFNEWGIPLFILHQFLNLVMAFFAASMISLSHINMKLNRREPKGSTSIPFLSFIFGLLTFGCAPCVIAFFSAIGIAFTPIIFPYGNLLWKVILLVLLAGGWLWILYSIQHNTCNVQYSQKKKPID